MINCDADPIIEHLHESEFQNDTVWETTIMRIINLKNELRFFKDHFRNSPKITWLLRSDWQTHKIWGDWCYPARKYRNLWQNFVEMGDEIGWHPHLWKFDHGKNIWYQEIYNNSWIRNCLENGYNEISNIFDIKSVRMGWTFHNDFTMNLLSSIGLRYDLSALPGIINNGNKYNIYDWKITPSHPYFPSKNNYRIEDKNPSNNLNLMEIPITTQTIPKYLQFFTGKKFMSANIAKNPFLFKNMVAPLINSIDNNTNCGCFLINTFFHPIDIKEKGFLFSLDNFKKNLSWIMTNSKIDFIFITPHEFVRQCKECKY